MSQIGRTVHIRMSALLTRRLDELRARYPSLPQSILVTFVLRSVLERTLDERVRIVEETLRRKPLED